MTVTVTEYMAQTPALTLHEIADRLWAHSEYEAYRAVLAYAKERSTMVRALKEVREVPARPHLARAPAPVEPTSNTPERN